MVSGVSLDGICCTSNLIAGVSFRMVSDVSLAIYPYVLFKLGHECFRVPFIL